MRTTVCSLAVLVAASGLAACDFTPTLDIETPEYVPGVAVRGFLVADSVALVRLGASWNPYEGRPINRNYREETPTALVTLSRDGRLVEALRIRPERCESFNPQTGETTPYECGPYVGTVPIEVGATYTLRVEAEGFAPAEATVTVPRSPGLEVTEEATEAGEPRRLRVRLTDPVGPSDLYGLALLRVTRYPDFICDQFGCTETGTETVFRGLTAFDTSDPLLIASAREFDDDISFASFSDETFDGETKAFTISPSQNYSPDDTDAELVVQVAALSASVYDTYQIEFGSGGDDNPFAEPVNLPSNVEGGYGLVGGIALAEVVIPPRE